MIIQAFKVELTKEEILRSIPKVFLNKIKSSGAKPYFQAYSLIQEGISRPKVLEDGGGREISWPRKAIQSISQKIQEGLKFFAGHGKNSNSHRNRNSLGEVVSHFAKEIGGRLHHIVVGYFPDKDEAKKYDICSIEADVAMRETSGGGYVAEAINKLTGIALGNSQEGEIPGFPGAKRLATVQAFEPDEDDTKQKQEGDSRMITFQEVKQFIEERNVWPHQFYSEEIMRADRKFGKLYTQLDELKQSNETLTTKFNETAEELSSFQKEKNVSIARDRFSNLIPDGTTELQKKFISKRFKPEKMEDVSDESIRKFIEEAQEEYQEMAKEGLIVTENTGGSSNESTDEKDDFSKLSEEEQLDQLLADSM